MGQRIVTGVVAGAAFIGLLVAGGWYYTGLLLLLALIGYWEYARLNGQKWTRLDVLIGFAAVLLIALPKMPFGWEMPSFTTITWVLMFVLLCGTVFSKNRIQLEHVSVLFLGAVYVGAGFHYMALTRDLEHGIFWSALTFACIWASDAGAYFVGKAIGKTKLWPAISPNKTIEGALGGLVIAIGVGLIFAYSQPEWVGVGQAALIGLTAAVAGQLGDLVQSAYKRFRNVKDSGQLLPGHGGVLDRTDSWLIVFPLVHMLGLLTM
ncbi:phosphatidate cytidylyltransferase [Cohnella cholangitidis]|uniref:Phosphatidate cytidylyltransferase n=1 Tax=Cohnella cholangitidis TaxID=2598458 RepID=A0A7G5BT51_9BACL|nr:phosphatidate cytidylyltransferase [Cohnella cholangitidis]QMV40135.1 phosphatidate cytidylyltransferase [Cohnella cholangitidis]